MIILDPIVDSRLKVRLAFDSRVAPPQTLLKIRLINEKSIQEKVEKEMKRRSLKPNGLMREVQMQ